MLDIKVIRNDPEMVKQAIKNRNKKIDVDIDALIAADDERRELISITDGFKSEQNTDSKQVPILKRENKNIEAAQLLERMKDLSEKIKENDAKIRELK